MQVGEGNANFVLPLQQNRRNCFTMRQCASPVDDSRIGYPWQDGWTDKKEKHQDGRLLDGAAAPTGTVSIFNTAVPGISGLVSFPQPLQDEGQAFHITKVSMARGASGVGARLNISRISSADTGLLKW